MAVTRFSGTEVEKLGAVKVAPLALSDALKANTALSQAIMKEVNSRYGSVDLAAKLQSNPKAFHVSFSWG